MLSITQLSLKNVVLKEPVSLCNLGCALDNSDYFLFFEPKVRESSSTAWSTDRYLRWRLTLLECDRPHGRNPFEGNQNEGA